MQITKNTIKKSVLLTGCWTTGVRFSAGAGTFSLHHRGVQTASGAHPASYPMHNGVYFLGREANHSPPYSADVK